MREPLMRARAPGSLSSALRAIFLGLVLAAAPISAEATVLAPLSYEQMTDAADLVVRGKVASLRTETDSRGGVWTVAELDVTRAYKGSVGTRVTVRTPGGAVADRIMVVEGMPRFSETEDVVMFLSARSAGDYLVIGGWQGKFTVRPDPMDGSPLVVRFTLPQTQPYDARFVPVPVKAEREGLGELETLIQARVESGWDGAPIPGISSERLRTINRLQPGVK